MDSVDGFLLDPTSVADHPLQNVMQGYRVVYRESADYSLFTDIGAHDQVYRVSVRA